MKYGMSIIVRGQDAGRETFDAMAEKAEAVGLDTLWASDHLILPPVRVSRYPGRADGQLPDAWIQAYYQPFSVLNYLAARTRTVRLGTSVLIVPMRNPIEIAAQVAELDRLSEGRFDFGVGVGWFREEFEALGYPFAERGARTDEALALMKTLWSESEATFEGRFHRFSGAKLEPKPMQRPHPPIYVGGSSPAALRRLARFGDAWHPLKPTPDQLIEFKPALEKALAAEGRALNDLPIVPKVALTFQDGPPAEGQEPTEGRPQDIVDSLRRYEDAGATEFCFDVRTESLVDVLDTMERFADEVRQKV
ncbi:MAG: LLM class F420-dependent oxidoreductase [Alphaproteobacteria bacterium]|nr:LLM class F420-dependent oxidoreductase [Alphaproteobacteria bacterium]